VTALTFDQCLTLQADRRPGAVALVCGGTRVTYSELDDRVSQVAARLAASGLTTGDRVVLVADNSADHLIVAFAVWRAGATLVTIYPSSSGPELAFAIGNAEPALVIAGSRVVDAVRRAATGSSRPVVELHGSGALVGLTGIDDRPRAQAADVDADALALICYTSGSTSRPKAVMHSHTGLLAAAVSYARVWRLDESDTTLVALPMAWAFGLVSTSMATLSAGGRVLILARAEPGQMLRSMAGDRATFFAGVTTMFVKLVGALEDTNHPPDLSSLRLCISGGEPRNETAFSRWYELSGCPVHDVYAASECFPVVTYDPVQDPLPRPGSAGRVVPGAQLRLLTPGQQEVAPGEAGEALARGPALLVGYWRDPALTAAVLTADGWYRTGDLARIDEDGYVYVVGRLTDMIIRGGANVSPAEVEAVLVRHADVREAAVVGIADAEYGEEVVAAVVLEPSAPMDADRLRAHCAGELAGYKVPTRFVALHHLPRNPHTGKVQRTEVAALLRDPAPSRVGP
jgi:long-chain acyl-CoA synthetase